jgi:hypothetical protein
VLLTDGSIKPFAKVPGRISNIMKTQHNKPVVKVSIKTANLVKKGMIGYIELEYVDKSYLEKLLRNIINV